MSFIIKRNQETLLKNLIQFTHNVPYFYIIDSVIAIKVANYLRKLEGVISAHCQYLLVVSLSQIHTAAVTGNWGYKVSDETSGSGKEVSLHLQRTLHLLFLIKQIRSVCMSSSEISLATHHTSHIIIIITHHRPLYVPLLFTGLL